MTCRSGKGAIGAYGFRSGGRATAVEQRGLDSAFTIFCDRDLLVKTSHGAWTRVGRADAVGRPIHRATEHSIRGRSRPASLAHLQDVRPFCCAREGRCGSRRELWSGFLESVDGARFS